MGVVYANPHPDIEPSLRNTLVECVVEDTSQKPWTLVNTVTEDSRFSETEVRTALKRLLLEHELRISSTGTVRTPSR